MFRRKSLKSKRSRARHQSSRCHAESLESRQLLTLLINELNISPTLTDTEVHQYIELRGEPNEVIGTGTYLVMVDARDNDAGEVFTMFDLSDIELGNNGFLVLSQFNNGYDVHEGATHITSSSTGFSGLPNGMFENSAHLPNQIVKARSSFLLVQTDVKPTVTMDIDADNDGLLDGEAANWEILDSVAYLYGRTDAISYAQVTFVEFQAEDYIVPDGGTVVQLDRSDSANYMARMGDSTGSSKDDWLAASIYDRYVDDDFRINAGIFGDPTERYLAGRRIDHLGTSNFFGQVSGSVYEDKNGNGVQDSGEEGRSDIDLFADLNGNGVHDDITVIVEPDDFNIGQEMTNEFYGMTLSEADDEIALGTGRINARRLVGSASASTGQLVFAHEGISWFQNNTQLRASFYNAASAISVDTIGTVIGREIYGVLEVYDKDRNLLESVMTQALDNNQVERLTIERETADIAFALIYTDSEVGPNAFPFGRYDNMSYTIPEPSATTDENGDYYFNRLDRGEHTITVAAPTNTVFTHPSQGSAAVDITNSEHFQDVDFGFRRDYDLAVSITDNLEQVLPGEEVTFWIDVTADDIWEAEGVTLTSDLPEILTDAYVKRITLNGGATSQVAEGASIDDVFMDSLGLPAGSSARYQISATVPISATGLIRTPVSLELPEPYIDGRRSNNSAIDESQIPVVSIAITTESESFDESGTTTLVVSREGTTRGSQIVDLTSSDPTEATVPEQVTIPNGESSVEVVLTFVDDDYVDGAQSVSVYADAVFGVTELAADVPFTVNDDEVAGIKISAARTAVSESGETDSFAVQLDDKPLGNVVVSLQSTDAEVTLSTDALTFTPENWNDPQFVEASGTDDEIVDGDQTVTIELTVDADNSHELFHETTATHEVVNEDDEVAEISIIKYGESNSTSEDGATDKVGFVLSGKPAGPIEIQISGGNTGEVALDRDSLTFTADNWNVPQDIEFTGIDDATFDGDKSVLFEVSVNPETSHPGYHSAGTESFIVKNVDNEEAAAIVEVDSESVLEKGAASTTSMHVRLKAAPVFRVVLFVRTNSSDELSIDRNRLTFLPGNWNVPQTISVTALDDDVLDGDQSSLISVTLDDANSDEIFSSFEPVDQKIVTVDDEASQLTLIETDGATMVAENGDGDSFSLSLSAPPETPVTFIAKDESGNVRFQPSFVTFTADNWSDLQTIGVSAIDDKSDNGDRRVMVSVNADDPAFTNLSASFEVDIADNDDAGMIVSHTDGSTTVTEGGEGDSFSVRLSSRPAGSVDVLVSVVGDVSADRQTITFDADNWNQPVDVRLATFDNDYVTGDQEADISLSIAAGSAAEYLTVSPTSFKVDRIDDEVAGIVVSATDDSTEVAEGGDPDELHIVLTARPRRNVTIFASEHSDLELVPAQVTFTPDNWNESQTFTVTAVDDEIADVDRSQTVSFAVDRFSSDTGFIGLDPATAEVSITGNDPAGFSVEETDGGSIVNEGGDGDSFTISLAYQPTATVVFDVSVDSGLVEAERETVVLTPDNWQSVTVNLSATENSTATGETNSVVAVSVASGTTATEFVGLDDMSFEVTATDNDNAGFTLTESEGETIVSENGSEDTILVVLTAQPDSAVTINVASTATEISTSTSTLTFNAENWNSPQEVTVTGVDDELEDGDVQTNVTFSIDSSSATEFAGLPAQTVRATTTDNEFTMSEGLDIDGDGEAVALRDGIVAIRYLAGFTGEALVTGAVNPEGSRANSEQIVSWMEDLKSVLLDVDGDSEFLPLTDGLLIIRYLADFRGAALIENAVSAGGTRTDAASIEQHLSQFYPDGLAFGPVPTQVAASTTDVGIALSQISTRDYGKDFVGPLPTEQSDQFESEDRFFASSVAEDDDRDSLFTLRDEFGDFLFRLN